MNQRESILAQEYRTYNDILSRRDSARGKEHIKLVKLCWAWAPYIRDLEKADSVMMMQFLLSYRPK